jgi:polar amino acid transport system substrate-binding protein
VGDPQSDHERAERRRHDATRGALSCLVAAALLSLSTVSLAQQGAASLDPRGRPPQPGTEQQAAARTSERLANGVLRFVTDADYPPFNFLDEEGTLTGFNVDMARALCIELDVSCDVQQRDWADLVPALKRGETDAIIASMKIDARNLRDVDFSDRYYFTPARFAARKGTYVSTPITPIGLESRRVAVVKGTAHEAFLRTFFRDIVLQPYDTAELAREALSTGRADLLFDDGISLSFWLNGTSSKGCCELRGGPFVEPEYFGDGIGVAVRKGDLELKRLISQAIRKVRESGQYAELVRRYFTRAYAADLERP